MKHLVGIGQDGKPGGALCKSPGEAVVDVRQSTCETCLWMVYSLLDMQKNTVAARMRELHGIDLQRFQRKPEPK